VTLVSSENIKRIIISRTDAIGDVVLTLPVAGILKDKFPGCTIIFFGRTYTKPVIDACEHVDEFINYDVFEEYNEQERKSWLAEMNVDAIIHIYPRFNIARAAKNAGIKIRIGTSNRIFHWWKCNKQVALSRKNSTLHEAQLNAKLLTPLGIEKDFTNEELSQYYGFKKIKPLSNELKKYFSPQKFNLIIHPKSNVSSREWSLERYGELINILPAEKFNVIITGSNNEKTLLDRWYKSLPKHIHNCAGKMSLEEFISFISHSDGLLAASTGPLHIAAALGKHAFGIYPPIRPLYPGRWAPLGKHAYYFVMDKTCNDCRSNPEQCHCMNEITAMHVAQKIVDASQTSLNKLP
jgi:heptosyltransferase III